MAPKWPELDQNLTIFSAPPPDRSPRPPAVPVVHTQGAAYNKWPRAPKFENRHCAQRYPVEVECVECDCIRQAEQFGHRIEKYRERFFTYVLLQSPTHLESYLLHQHYTSQLDNLYDNIEVDQIEVDWITWHTDKMWGDSRTSIFKAMKCK